MADLPPIRVLLVTDSSIRREVGRQLLALTRDIEVSTAADGLEALELALPHGPDVIVADLLLPVMSGPELLRRCRSAGCKSKILALAPSTRPSVSGIAFASGADLVLPAPARWDEILRSIRFLAGGLSRTCRGLLDRMGAPQGWAGTAQAALCAGAMGEGRCPLLKHAYAEAAAQMGTGVDCVEVNIRRVIKAVHRLRSPVYQSLPGLDPAGEPPSNGEFLTALAQAAKIPL